MTKFHLDDHNNSNSSWCLLARIDQMKLHPQQHLADSAQQLLDDEYHTQLLDDETMDCFKLEPDSTEKYPHSQEYLTLEWQKLKTGWQKLEHSRHQQFNHRLHQLHRQQYSQQRLEYEWQQLESQRQHLAESAQQLLDEYHIQLWYS